MVDRRIVEEWLKKADEDFDFASSVIEKSSFYAQICFHYHQSAEKYLKAFIVALELEFKKIHDLLELLNICKKIEPSLSIIQDNCTFLNRFYIDTRYPVYWPTNYTKEDTMKSQKAAQNIAITIKNLLRKGDYV